MSHRIDRRRLRPHGLCLAAGAGLGWLAARPGAALPEGLAAEAADETPEGRLRKLKLELPKVTPPKAATLVPAVRVGNLLYVSGHGPLPRGGKPVVGKVGKELSLKEGREAARSVGLVILSVVRGELGSLDRVHRLVKTLGMVNCTPDFTQQPQVINGFSDLMVEVFGNKLGKGARSAVGMGSLPGGIPVEIECVFQVKESGK
jgi:enamine deaminase RidA (YjgF/YER057c/UK114 family)